LIARNREEITTEILTESVVGRGFILLASQLLDLSFVTPKSDRD